MSETKSGPIETLRQITEHSRRYRVTTDIGAASREREDPRQTWRTPLRLFLGLHMARDYARDCAASADNALLPKFWTAADNCLEQALEVGERGFCNPPFGNVPPFVAWAQLQADTGAAVDLLVPCSTNTAWFRRAVTGEGSIPAGFWTFDGRVEYEAPGGVGKSSGAFFDSALLCFGADEPTGWRGIRSRRDGSVIYEACIA